MPRRYGAGSVYQRSRDGKWVATWEVANPGGRKRRSVVAASSGAAIKRMQAAQKAEGSSSSRSRPPTESVGAFLERWLVDVVRVTRRERTLVGYGSIFRGLPESFTRLELADLDDTDVQALVNGLPHSPQTVHHYAAMLRTAFTYAVRRRFIDRNPATAIDLPNIRRTERIPLTADEVRAFLDASRDDPLFALWVTTCWTGMRQGELLGLRWQDVSLTRAQITVRGSLSRLPPKPGRKDYRYVLTEPKTSKSRRPVPLLPDVVEALRPVERWYMRHRETFPKDQGLVFCTEHGSPLDGPTVTRLWQAALVRAGVRPVRFHDARHGVKT